MSRAGVAIRHLVALVASAAVSVGCYSGSARDANVAGLAREGRWVVVQVPLVEQHGESDCGTAALASVLGYWGRPTSVEAIDRGIQRRAGARASAAELEDYARARGLSAFTLFATFDDVRHELDEGRPVIVGVAKPYSPGRARAHFEVVVGYEPGTLRVLTLDPARGARENELSGFLAEWEPTGRVALVAAPL
jgi:ABC-type bacteriocin/lantibiotic exporter with double-glycine peptidase domain